MYYGAKLPLLRTRMLLAHSSTEFGGAAHALLAIMALSTQSRPQSPRYHCSGQGKRGLWGRDCFNHGSNSKVIVRRLSQHDSSHEWN